MYRVICETYGKEYVLMDLRDEQYSLINPVLTVGVNIAGSFTFTIPPTHPNYNCIVKLVSKIKVFRILKDGTKKWLFTGRSMTDEMDFSKTNRIECEGILAYLIDSVVRPYEHSGSPIDYFKQLINSHNSQVEAEKQFVIGNVDLVDTDSNNYIVRANAAYPSTYNEIAEKIVNSLDCHLYAEEKEGKQYIHCTMLRDGNNTQVIRFGDNLIDLTRKDTAENLKTVIIPLGKQDDEGSYLTIKDVNNGLDFVEDETAVSIYGRIVGTVNFDDVTLPENLIKKGRAYLKEVLAPFSTITVGAVDMSMKSEDIAALELGYVQVISKPHNLDKRIMLSQMELHLLDPASDTYTLGITEKAMSASMVGVNRLKADVAAEIQSVKKETSSKVDSAIENATQLITGAKGGYVFIDDDGEGHPWRILIMDNADKAQAKNVIQLNKNGLGFSTTGIDGEYANAWTIDGNLVADFITAGTMYADRISGGTLTMGGVDNKSGVIQILNGEGNVIGEWNKDGISILDGAISGSTITSSTISGSALTLGKSDNAGVLTVYDENENVVGTWDKNGLNINKGAISGSSINVGGSNNTDGTLTVKNSSGAVIGTWNKDGLSIASGLIKGAKIEGNEIEGGTIKGAKIEGNEIEGGTIEGTTVTGGSIKGSKIESGDTSYSSEYIKIEDGVLRGGRNGDGGYVSFASYISGNWNMKLCSGTIGLFCTDIVVGERNTNSYKTGVTEEITIVTAIDDDGKATTKKLTFTKGILTKVE